MAQALSPGWWALAALGLFAFSVRLAFDWLAFPILSPQFDLLRDDGYDRIAENLIGGLGYAGSNGMPTIARLPLYPLFLAVIFQAFGTDLRVTQVLQAGLDGGTTLVLASIAHRLFGRPAALVSGGLFALYPPSILYAARFYSESLYTFLLASFVLTVVCLIEAEGRPRYAIVGGVLLGCLGLTRVVTVVVPMFFLPILLIQWRPLGVRRGMAVASAILLLMMALVLTPWLARNYSLTGTLTLGGVDVGTPLESWRKRLDCGDPSVSAARGNETEAATAHGSAVPEIESNRRALSVVARQFLNCPGRTAGRFLEGLVLVWFQTRTTEMMIVAGAIHLALLFFTFGALRRAWREGSEKLPQMALVLSVVGCFVVVHAATFPFIRYIVPVVPLVMLFAGAGLAETTRRRSR